MTGETAKRPMPFTSDSESGVHPVVMEAIGRVNAGAAASYGADAVTAAMTDAFKDHFGSDCEAYPVMNGTGANVLALQLRTQRWGAALCTDVAHLYNDECGAVERHAAQLLPTRSHHGKMIATDLDIVPRRRPVHQSRPTVLSVTQATEMGTVYDLDELAALVERAHGLGMSVHMDGARLCNAAASLNIGLREMTTDLGVDVVSFGGTKNGCMVGECVLVLNPSLARRREVETIRKSSMQLVPKMRFVAAQYVALLQDDLWLHTARHANRMAVRLADAIQAEELGVVRYPVQANMLFVDFFEPSLEKLFAAFQVRESPGPIRLVTSFETTDSDISGFIAVLAGAASLQW